jgi:hypothetical protein
MQTHNLFHVASYFRWQKWIKTHFHKLYNFKWFQIFFELIKNIFVWPFYLSESMYSKYLLYDIVTRPPQY